MKDFCTEQNLTFNLAHLLGDSHPVLVDLLFSLPEIKMFDNL